MAICSARSSIRRHHCPCSYLVIKMRKSLFNYLFTSVLSYFGLSVVVWIGLPWGKFWGGVKNVCHCVNLLCLLHQETWCLWVCRPVQGSLFLPRKERGFWYVRSHVSATTSLIWVCHRAVSWETPPKGHEYSLCSPKREVMDENIQGALSTGSSVLPILLSMLDFSLWEIKNHLVWISERDKWKITL